MLISPLPAAAGIPVNTPFAVTVKSGKSEAVIVHADTGSLSFTSSCSA